MTTEAFNIYAGSTWRLSGTYVDAEGANINLTTYTAALQARTSYDSDTALIDLTDGDGITLGNGTFEIVVPASVTGAITAPSALFDFVVVSPGGEVTTLIASKINITQNVTRLA